MDRLGNKMLLSGGGSMSGVVSISGSKNSTLPMIAASILTDGDVTLHNIPLLSDVRVMLDLLPSFGACIKNISAYGQFGSTVVVGGEKSHSVEDDFCTKMSGLFARIRASSLFLGPALARFGCGEIYFPGGCPIGSRPLDVHFAALEKMGVVVEAGRDSIIARVPNKLRGTEIDFPIVSVGATENIMMAAVLAEGTTVMRNAAKEPEIVDLANMLRLMGAKITGDGTGCVVVEGVSQLKGCNVVVNYDRIEAATYAIMAIVSNGCIDILGEGSLQKSVLHKLNDVGGRIELIDGGYRVTRRGDGLFATDISTGPYPDFPSDLQAPFMTLLAVARGRSRITENIFENRFMHVNELQKMGANIVVRGSSAYITGVSGLVGCAVRASDLRAAASLVIASMIAKGPTIIDNAHYIDRGYSAIQTKLRRCGIEMQRDEVLIT